MRNNCNTNKVENWPENFGDGFLHVVDIGNPLVRITHDDFNNDKAFSL